MSVHWGHVIWCNNKVIPHSQGKTLSLNISPNCVLSVVSHHIHNVWWEITLGKWEISESVQVLAAVACLGCLATLTPMRMDFRANPFGTLKFIHRPLSFTFNLGNIKKEYYGVNKCPLINISHPRPTVCSWPVSAWWPASRCLFSFSFSSLSSDWPG